MLIQSLNNQFRFNPDVSTLRPGIHVQFGPGQSSIFYFHRSQDWPVRVILTLAKSPFFLVLVFLILIKTVLCLVQIIFKSTRLGYKANGSLGLVTRKFPNLFDVAEVSTWDELDFLLNRSFAYVRKGFSSEIEPEVDRKKES